MSPTLRQIVLDLTPPLLWRGVNRCSRRGIRFTGNYNSWETAKADADGYDSAVILDRLLNAARQVREGRAAFERDTVLFHEPDPPWPLTAALLGAAAMDHGRLSVLDIGGSLGSTLYRCQPVLRGLASLRWAVVEQPHIVECGRGHFQDDTLVFHDSIRAAVSAEQPNIAVLSSVLPYVPQPHEMLTEVMDLGLRRLVVDRTPFFADAPDRLTIQHVPAEIYGQPVSYPAWFFDRRRFEAEVTRTYRIVSRFRGEDGQARVGSLTAQYLGYILESPAVGQTPAES